MGYVIEVGGLKKKYKSLWALDGIDLDLEENKIYGLLGRNGVGKTTLLRAISTQLMSVEGELKLFGENPYKNQEVLKKVCFIKTDMNFNQQLDVAYVLKFCSGMYENWDEEFALSLVKDFGLYNGKKIKHLSTGMKTILGNIIGLASRAPLTMFDEPYLGLDAAARQLFYDVLLKDYAENPRTIVISSHLIDEMAALLEDVIIMKKGKIELVANCDELRQKALYVNGNKHRVLEALANKRIIDKEEVGANIVAATLDDFSEAELEELEAQGFNLSPISIQKLFIYLSK